MCSDCMGKARWLATGFVSELFFNPSRPTFKKGGDLIFLFELGSPPFIKGDLGGLN